MIIIIEMNSKILLIFIITLWISTLGKPEIKDSKKDTPSHFKTKFASSSMEIYDALEFDTSSIFIVNFYLYGDGHEKQIEELEGLLKDNKSTFNKIVYMPIDALDHYQFGGILYN